MQAILVEGGFDVRGMKIAHSKGLVALLVLLLVQGITRLNPAEPGRTRLVGYKVLIT